MSAIPWIPPDISKEIRALLPLWLGCVLAVWAGGLPDEYGLFLRVGFVMYVLGSAALGALSVGHEYSHHTLPLLLSVPVSRRRIFAIKSSVLLVMLVLLSAVALARLPVTPAGHEMQDTAVVGVMSLLGGAFLAPWLTMLCRNAIAGALFALSLPAGLLVGSEIFSIMVLGEVGTPAAERVRMEIFWSGMLLLSAIGAFSSWRSFLKLQVIDGPHAELGLPKWLSRADSRNVGQVSRRSSPLWTLLWKELHLQQLTFVVSVLYVCGWALILLTWHSAILTIDQPVLILTVVHGGIVALLAGSLASAEERHLGTLDWQVLLPMSAARQWLVKCGVVFGVVVVLALALPALLAVIKPSIEPMRVNAIFVATVLVAAAVSLYVSSLCGSGLKALMIAVPAAFATLPVLELCDAAAHSMLRLTRIVSGDRYLSVRFDVGTVAVEVTILIALLLRVALINHRSGSGGGKRIWAQLGLVVGLMVVGMTAITAAQMLVLRR